MAGVIRDLVPGARGTGQGGGRASLAVRSWSDTRGPAPRGGTADYRAGCREPVAGWQLVRDGGLDYAGRRCAVGSGGRGGSVAWTSLDEDLCRRTRENGPKLDKVARKGPWPGARIAAEAPPRHRGPALRPREGASRRAVAVGSAGSSWVCPRPGGRQGTEMRPRSAREVKASSECFFAIPANQVRSTFQARRASAHR